MSRVSRNILYNFVGQSLLLVVGFLAVKNVFGQLGGDALGLLYASVTLATLVAGVLDLGISSTTVREISNHHESEPEYTRSLLRTFSALYWILYLTLAAAIYASAPLLAHGWIRLQSIDAPTATALLRILAVSALLVLPRSLYASIFRGFQRMGFNNAIDVVVSVLQQVGIVVILFLGGGVFHVAAWYGACYAASILAYVVAASRLVGLSALTPGYSAPVVRRTLGFSSHMMAISILGVIHTQADKVFVSKLLPVATFGSYSVAAGLVARGTLLTGAIAQAAFPSLSKLAGLSDWREFAKQYRKLHDFLCLTTVPFFAAIVFAALPLFTYILNRQIAELLLVPTAILAIGWYMNGTVNLPYISTLAMGKPYIAVQWNLIALGVTLPITAALIIEFGLIGAALSWVVHHGFLYAYAVPRICRECLNISPREWYAHIGRIFALAGCTYGVAFLIALDRAQGSLVYWGIAYVLASVAFVGIAWRIMGIELRESLLQLLERGRRRRRTAEVRS